MVRKSLALNHDMRRSITIESNDCDELSDYFSQRVSKVTISPASDVDCVKISSSVVPIADAIAIDNTVPYGARFLQKEDLDGLFVFLPISGRALIRTGARVVPFSQAQGFIGTMNEGDVLECSERFSLQALKLSKADLTRTLSHLLDRPIINPIEFAPSIDPGSTQARALHTLMLVASRPIEGAPFLAPSSHAAKHFSEALSIFVLESFRHSYSELMTMPEPTVRPKHVARAIEYMRSNASRALTLQDLSAAAGVSVRALHYGFKQFLKVSPMEHLREIRLKGAYDDLLSAPAEVSIAEISKKWGFVTSRHFAMLCKRSYGRTPSEIRRHR